MRQRTSGKIYFIVFNLLFFYLFPMGVLASGDDDFQRAAAKKDWNELAELFNKNPDQYKGTRLDVFLKPFASNLEVVHLIAEGKIPVPSGLFVKSVDLYPFNLKENHDVGICMDYGQLNVGQVKELKVVDYQLYKSQPSEKIFFLEIEDDGSLISSRKGLKTHIEFKPIRDDCKLWFPPRKGDRIFISSSPRITFGRLTAGCILDPKNDVVDRAKSKIASEWNGNQGCETIDVKKLNQAWNLVLNVRNEEENIRLFEAERSLYNDFKKRGFCGEVDEYRVYFAATYPGDVSNRLPLYRFTDLKSTDIISLQHLKNSKVCLFSELNQLNLMMNFTRLLTEEEKATVLELESKLATLLSPTWGERVCAQNDLYPIEVKQYLELSKEYRSYGDIDWEKYHNKKISKNDLVLINKVLDKKYSVQIGVPFAFQGSGDSPVTSKERIISDLKADCAKYKERSVRQRIRNRVLEVITNMNDYEPTDESARPAEGNVYTKIKAARADITKAVTQTLNSACK